MDRVTDIEIRATMHNRVKPGHRIPPTRWALGNKAHALVKKKRRVSLSSAMRNYLSEHDFEAAKGLCADIVRLAGKGNVDFLEIVFQACDQPMPVLTSRQKKGYKAQFATRLRKLLSDAGAKGQPKKAKSVPSPD